MVKVRFQNVYSAPGSAKVLFDLLKEREARTNISHRRMPAWKEHVRFVRSKPYRSWKLILSETGDVVGAVYLSKMNEIGLFIFRRFRKEGFGRAALQRLMAENRGRRLLANINPKNKASIAFFGKAGFKHIQNTYELNPSGGNV